ncbi:MAG: hypothetical protein IT178_05055 [Acidobacteria bacterium]|nr:hypothetical protein [Acidobacteriota bacterium]
MSRVLSLFVIVALFGSALPVSAAAADEPTAAARPLQLSIQKAAVLAAREMTPAPAMAATPVAPRPFSGTDRSRKQMGGGGGKAAMVLTLVGSLVGVAATVYMVREMKKSSEADSQQ